MSIIYINPYQFAAAGPTDPDFANVSLLLHGDGTNGSTTIVDSSSSPKTVTAFGNAQISTAQSKFGGSSVAFDGTGDYLVSASNVDFAFGTGDFTIEFWLYTLTTQASMILVDLRTSPSQITPTIFIQGSVVNYYVNSATRIFASTSILANTWVHLALARSQGSTRLFINGTQSGSTYADSNNYIQSPVYIGARWDGAASLNGYIDDFRITKGVARYVSNFTPPTAPFPDVGPTTDPYFANVSLLLHGDGTNGSTTVIDSSPSPKTGSVEIGRASCRERV